MVTAYILVQCAPGVPQVSTEGIPSASAPVGFVVRAQQVLNAKPGLLLYSMAGPASTPFGGGTLCVSAPIKRAPAVPAGGTPPPVVDCTGVLELDMNAFAAGALGGTPALPLSSPGTAVNCQWYGRDTGFPAPNSVQLTDAVEYLVAP